MTDVLEEFNQLKQAVEQAQQKADRAAGALEQITKTLQKDFDCKDATSATKKLKELQEQEIRHKKEFKKAIEDFKKRWSDRL